MNFIDDTHCCKLELPFEPKQYVLERLAVNRFVSLPIALQHALEVQELPMHHRDPFDRILIAQARVEKLPIMTADGRFSPYPVEVIPA